MKRKNNISIIFLGIAILLASVTLGLLIIQQGNNVFGDISFYVICGALFSLIIAVIVSFTNRKNHLYIETLENRLELWNTISYKVKGAGETAFKDLPIGVLVLDKAYRVKWSNQIVQKMLMINQKEKELKDIANGKIFEFVKDIEEEQNQDDVITNEIELFKKIYQIIYVQSIRIIYLTEITSFVDLKNQYANRTVAIGYINVDNLEEALSDLDVQDKSECQGKITTAIVKWSDKFKAYVRAFSDSKFMLMTNYSQLVKMMEDNFGILDEIKLILKTTKAVHVTLSIGIACEDLHIKELSDLAEDQLELALNRGGDQAVVLVNGTARFYGAKTDPTRKEVKVQLRYKYQELEALIKGAGTVFCCGHKWQDADSFGATIAMYNLASALGKQVYIIFDENSIDATVRKVYEDVKKYHKVLLKSFVTPDKAADIADDKSLLMVSDCQSKKQVLLNDKQLSAFKKIGIIDHHRKNDDGTIPNPIYYYSEPAASSSVEVIFTLLEFSEYELNISDSEATWMLLGIVVDTNNFVYRSSNMTFEIAALLAKKQASMGRVKEYLKEKKEEKLQRNKLIGEIEVYRGNVAIAVQTDDTELEAATLAKVSDELLSIEGFILAVTCGYITNKKIRISARSLGKVNCQVLMEKLGGGGHLTASACTMDISNMKIAVKRLKDAIDEVLKEEEFKKIILQEDVKNIGRKGEILEVAIEQANNLISSSHAIEATAEAIRMIEQEKQEEAQEAAKKLQEFYEIKKLIEKDPLKIIVDTDDNGHILEIVNNKTISSALEKAIGIKIDRRKITFNDRVVALGLYEAQVNLNNEIYATITLHIVEKPSK
ncbi:MAG: 50S ribosomal protein L9 [Erysipelotrichaceae bacterium]|nr:50S ribosomal protein L9 [Erysipelotrichaceae bacterium]